MLRNAQNVCNNNIAFLFFATKSLRFYRNEVHLRCGLCQCRIHYSLLVHMAVFFCFFGPFLFLFLFYFVHIHRRKAKKKSSELYNIVIIQKDLFFIFFFFYKKSQSVAAQRLVGREGREKREICLSMKSVSSTAPNQIHIWAMGDSTSPLKSRFLWMDVPL